MRHSLIPRHFVEAALCALLGAAFSLPGMEQLATHHGDEAFYLEIAWRMLDTGNYTVPVFYDELILDRAPLFYWMIALSYRLFGFSLLVGRLPTLVATGLLYAAVYLLAVWLYGNRRGAVYAVLVMMSFPVTHWITRLAVPDLVMSLGVLGTLVFYYRATLATHPMPWLVASSVALAWATMAKGHVGLVVAAVPLGIFLLTDLRSPQRLPWKRLLVPDFWLPALLLGGWWYLYLLQSSQLVGEVAPRSANAHLTLGEALYHFLFSEAAHQVDGGWSGLQRNLRDYTFGGIAWFFPWSPVLIYGCFGGARRLRREWREQPRELRLLLSLAGGVFALFTFFVLELRSMRYALPAAPAVAILVGRILTSDSGRLLRHVPIVLSLACATTWGVVYQFVIPYQARPPLQDVCAKLREQLEPGDRVATLALGHHWTTFGKLLLQRPLAELGEAGQSTPDDRVLAAAYASDYVLARKSWADRLRRRAPARFSELSRSAGGPLASRRGLFEPVALLRVLDADPGTRNALPPN